MKRTLFLILTAGLLAAMPLGAQVISLKSCLETGLKNNYSLRIVRNEERMAENNATRANAGYLPTVSANAGYTASLDSRNTNLRSGAATRERGVQDNAASAGINAEWTIFDGYKVQTSYKRLQELRRQSATQTRIALEDYMANLAAEYYNFVQQRLRLRNLQYAVALSRERLRIVRERYVIGSNSRLDLQQAQVDFNADSAQSLKQRELLTTSAIRLNELMAIRDVDSRFTVRDTAINLCGSFSFDSLWVATQQSNARLFKAAQDRTLAELDLKSVRSRDFPYVKLGASYGYNYNDYGSGTSKSRHNWGAMWASP